MRLYLMPDESAGTGAAVEEAPVADAVEQVETQESPEAVQDPAPTRDERGRFARQTPEEMYDIDAEAGERQQQDPAAPVKDEVPAEGKQEAQTPEQAQQQQQAAAAQQITQAQTYAPELLARAEAAGMRASEILKLGPDKLQEVLPMFEARMPKQDNQQAAADGKQVAPKDFKIELADGEFDPRIVKTLHDMNAHYSAHVNQMVQMQQQVNQFMAYVRTQQAQQYENRMDDLFKGLGDDYSADIGKGGVRELPAGGKEFQARVKVIEQMDVLSAGYAARGKQIPAAETLFKEAVRLVLGDKAKQQISRQLGKRQGSIVARPTQRDSKSGPKDPDEDAKEFVRQKFKELGMTTEEDKQEF